MCFFLKLTLGLLCRLVYDYICSIWRRGGGRGEEDESEKQVVQERKRTSKLEDTHW